jgi:hypothetical protein
MTLGGNLPCHGRHQNLWLNAGHFGDDGQRLGRNRGALPLIHHPGEPAAYVAFRNAKPLRQIALAVSLGFELVAKIHAHMLHHVQLACQTKFDRRVMATPPKLRAQ